MSRLFIFIYLCSVSIVSIYAQDDKKLTLEDIFLLNKFGGKTVEDVHWLPDGSAFTFTRQSDRPEIINIYLHNVKTGNEKLVLDGDKLEYDSKKVLMSEYKTTGNQNHLLITGQKQQIWRHSYMASYYLYDMANKKLTALANNNNNIQNVELSPDGNHVAYVKENNLYVASVGTGESKQLTSDGSSDILNGVFDWVYEEEFGRADAFRWSPDGKKIAYWHTDQTRVKEFTLLDELGNYSKSIRLKYPKVGEQNAIVEIGVVDIINGKTVWIDLGNNDDVYIPRIEWTNSSRELAIQRLNRKQNRLELVLSDIDTGVGRVILTDVNEAWLDITDDFIFLKKKDQFVWTSEVSGYRHIYLNDYEGKIVAVITSGDWEVSSVIGVDEKEGWVYFYGKKDASIEQQIYRADLKGKKLGKISAGSGWHTANFSPTFKHYLSFYSDVNSPTQVSLNKSDGKLVRILEENIIPSFEEYNLVPTEFMTIRTSEGVELNAWMMKPKDFDSNKKYPVLVYGYGGPGSQRVVNRWYRYPRNLWHQFMTGKGYIIFSVDNRGTGGKGKAFKNLSYGDLSKWAVNDQIEGARYLATLAYVDPSRIGFWGWSGGGYLTCMMMTRGSQFFSTGVAVASVTDFRNYDTIWTERYMGLLNENKNGYDSANVLNYADKLKGKLLLIHGSGDDNVHPQNTIQFVEELIAKNIQFDLMIYPNRNHSIHGGNTSLHLYTLMSNYFLTNL